MTCNTNAVKSAKRRETASKTLAFSFARCNQPRSQNVSDCSTGRANHSLGSATLEFPRFFPNRTRSFQLGEDGQRCRPLPTAATQYISVITRQPTPPDALDLPFIARVPLYFRTCRITMAAIREE